MMTRVRGYVRYGLVAVIVALLAGCTSAPSAGKAAGNTAAPASETKGSAATGGPSAAAVAEAKQALAAASGEAKFISPGGAIDVSKLKGKALWIISADLSIPFHQNIVKGYEEAAQAAGLQSVKFDGKGQTQEFSRGIEQAIAAKAAAIALISIDTQYVSGAVKRANDAKIPVIGILNTDARAKPDPGTSGEATIDYTGSGELLAAYAITNTNGPVNALYSDVSEFRVMGFLKQGIFQGFKKWCPEACTIGSYDTQMANFKTQSQTLTQSELRKNPKTNWVFAAFDAQALFVVPSVKDAGFGDKVRVGSINAVTANLEMINRSEVQVVDVGNSNAWLGWAGADRAMRAALGEPAAISVVPIKLFEKANLQGADVNNEEALFKGTDFRAEYKKLWGVK